MSAASTCSAALPSARPSRSSTSLFSSAAVSTMRFRPPDSPRSCTPRARRVTSASPRITVSGVRKAWLMSANMRRRAWSTRCRVWLLCCSSLVRSATLRSRSARERSSSARRRSSSATIQLKLTARFESSSRPETLTRWSSPPRAIFVVPSIRASIGAWIRRRAHSAVTTAQTAATSDHQRPRASSAAGQPARLGVGDRRFPDSSSITSSISAPNSRSSASMSRRRICGAPAGAGRARWS